MIKSRAELWKPRNRDIKQAKIACACPDDVQISRLWQDADFHKGTGIPDGALVLSPNHLKYIRFPLHPLFHVILGALDLHPMQLNPNSYLQFSAFLAFGLMVGTTVDFCDFFHFHDCIPIRQEVQYFHFASKKDCIFFKEKPTSEKNWKNRPLLITGNWAAPELRNLRIRSDFAITAGTVSTSLDPKRIEWLKTFLVGGGLNIKEFSTHGILLQISQNRDTIIYHPFQHGVLELRPNLEGKALAKHIVQSLVKCGKQSDSSEHLTERQRMRKRIKKVNKRVPPSDSSESSLNNDGAKSVHSFPDPSSIQLDHAGLMMPRELPPVTFSQTRKLSKQKKKRSGSSPAIGVEKRLKIVSAQTLHSPRTSMEPISSPTYSPLQSIDSIPLNKEMDAALQISRTTDSVSRHFQNCWTPKFKKHDGTFVTEEEKLRGNPEACLAVWQGLVRPADASAFQNATSQDIIKDMSSRLMELGQMTVAIENSRSKTEQKEKHLIEVNKNMEKELDELKLELKVEKQRRTELESQLHKVEVQRDSLKERVIEVHGVLAKREEQMKEVRNTSDLEYQKAKSSIVRESARYFRFGWTQAQCVLNERIIDDPDDMDAELGLEPGAYGLVEDDQKGDDGPEDEEDEEDKDDQEDEDDEDDADDPVDEDDSNDQENEDDEDDVDDPVDEDDSNDQENEDDVVDLAHPLENIQDLFNSDLWNSLAGRDTDDFLDFSIVSP